MNHHHHNGGDTEIKGAISDRDKLEKLLEYWIKHNEEHANTYLEWSKKAITWDIKDVAEILNEAANTALSLNTLFKEALKKL
jgi:hypothetical protein